MNAKAMSPVTRWRKYIQLREYVYRPTFGLPRSAMYTPKIA